MRGGTGGTRGRSPPLVEGYPWVQTPLTLLGAARGQGPIHPSRQRSGPHHAQGAWAAGSLESALLQGLGESDTATQHGGQPDATKAAEPDLPAVLMDLPVNQRRPLLKFRGGLQGEAGVWTHVGVGGLRAQVWKS